MLNLSQEKAVIPIKYVSELQDQVELDFFRFPLKFCNRKVFDKAFKIMAT